VTTFRFRPRFRALAWACTVGGAALALVAAWTSGDARWLMLGIGCSGTVLGGLYLLSPAWRYQAIVDDDGLEVLDGHGDQRFRLGWHEVERVIASPSTHTCVVSGGTAERTLIVPGPGAPAPYDIDDKHALFDEIMARVPPDVVQEVDLVENAER